MRVGILVQARMTSKRLPGKVLTIVNGKPLIGYLIERLAFSKFANDVVVVTSTEKEDDPIKVYCDNNGISCFRGSLYNVANRYYKALNCFQFDAFVRISGDSPFIDQELVDYAINLYRKNRVDIVTNVFDRSYPSGLSVEVIRSDIYKNSYQFITKPEDREHVTKFFYRNHKKYNILNFKSKTDYSNIKMSVDTIEDLNIFKAILGLMEKPHYLYSQMELIDLYRHFLKDRSVS